MNSGMSHAINTKFFPQRGYADVDFWVESSFFCYLLRCMVKLLFSIMSKTGEGEFLFFFLLSLSVRFSGRGQGLQLLHKISRIETWE